MMASRTWLQVSLLAITSPSVARWYCDGRAAVVQWSDGTTETFTSPALAWDAIKERER